jgi:hypothetical protein
MIVVIAVVALLAIGGGVTGLILASGGKKKHDTHQSNSPTNRPTNGTGTPDFPTGSGTGVPTGGTDFPTGGSGLPTGGTDVPTGGTDFPTGGSGSTTAGGEGTAAQVKIATTAQTVVHALGNTQPNVFCPLVDPADLRKLLKAKHIDKCSNVELNESYRNDYRHYAVTDPSAIKITGRLAVIPGSAATPSDFGGVEMREDTDGTWKYRFYTT